MSFTVLKYLSFIVIVSVVMFFINGYILSFIHADLATFYYQLSTLYIVFTISSIVIIGILMFIKSKNLDIVGMSFLVLTSIKMVFCYVLVRPILSLSANEMSIQKMNFFVIFILFLAIETIVTIRILNNK